MSSTSVTGEEQHDGGTSALAKSVLQGFGKWQSRYPILQFVALVVIVAYGIASIPGYGSTASMKSMLVLAALLGLAALPATVVALLGGIDFSIPAFIAAGGAMTVVLAGGRGWALAEVILLIILLCGVGGAISGFLCHRFLANPLIITLGMGAVVSGIVLISTEGNITDTPPASLVKWTAVNGETFGIAIPPVVVLWAVVAIVTGLVLSRTPAGRRLYATGTNLQAARLALLRTEVIWTVVFSLSAIFSGLTGVLIASYASGATPGMGEPYLFQGIVALIIGGTAIGYCSGDYWRTVLGSLSLTAITTVLIGKGFDGTDTQILFGFVILIVVAFYGRESRLRERV